MRPVTAAGGHRSFRAGSVAEPSRKPERVDFRAIGRVGRICPMFRCVRVCAGMRDAKYTKMLPTLPTIPVKYNYVYISVASLTEEPGRVEFQYFRDASGLRLAMLTSSSRSERRTHDGQLAQTLRHLSIGGRRFGDRARFQDVLRR